jgi:short subunit dehydrogenase-like uncharacterized protein
LIQACIRTGTHYLDITGEISVFEYAKQCDEAAKHANVLLCPGVGFDVIPTDCVANTLKKALPDACHLSLGFDSRSPLSPGTAKTAVEGLALGGRVRKNGQLESVPLAYKTRTIDFGEGEKLAMTIPWGDISTAYFSTQIPNIEVYVPTNKQQVSFLKKLNLFKWLFSFGFMQNWLKHKAGQRNGPDESQRKQQNTWVWGEAINAQGQIKTAKVKTANGYELTITGSLMAVEFILNNKVAAGYTTPALLMGEDAISKLPGCSKINLE